MVDKRYLVVEFQERYKECIRMLNGLEKTLEKKLPEKERCWGIAESPSEYSDNNNSCNFGWPVSDY
jgi:hypothetical protein